ncbi:MAG: hypothetical protein JW955_06460 [Sedimentisphaerales bacterium]|nr:hypothetical protein [Sedimentisphaerales bacterium]
MRWTSVPLAMVVLVVASVAPLAAQERLGDLVAMGGYDWVIGRWAATTDHGEKAEFRYDWVCDKSAVLAETTIGGFKYEGMIMLLPGGGEAVDVGADNRGGLWKGSWTEDPAGLVHRVEHVNAQGDVRKGDIIHNRIDANTISIAIYAVENGSRSAEPWVKMAYRRQTGAPVAASSSGQTSSSTDYETLGDMVSQGGYEWLIGKWTATKDGRTYQLEHIPILDQHAALVRVAIDDFKYCGIVTYAPARQEIAQIGADNMGRVWKATWEQGDEGAVHKAEVSRPDGTVQKMQIVYIRGDNDTLKTKEYSIEGGSPTLRDELTFKRRKP